MSLNIVKQYSNYKENIPDDIINILNNILSNKNGFKKKTDNDTFSKSKLINILNTISNKNKDSLIEEFKNYIKYWKQEYNDILIKVIYSQNLYTDIYIELFQFLYEEDKNSIIQNLLQYSQDTNTQKTIGCFLGEFMIKYNKFKYIIDIINNFDNDTKNKQSSKIISIYIILCKKGYKHYITNDDFNTFSNMKLSTSSTLLLYDLEDIY
tara:strand:+ start:24336 stop:24962 length:627 start_codon:yes stop_codon:yes gene_type:complete